MPTPATSGEAFRAGAAGYIVKGSATSELLRAPDRAARPALPHPGAAVSILAPGHLAGEPRRGRLAARQREVLHLVAEEHSARRIAALLRIPAKTVLP